jgi:photosystem II stability/assembly factor-like uncharacterized protein
MGREQGKKSAKWKDERSFVVFLILFFSFFIIYDITVMAISQVEGPYAEWEVSILEGLERTTFNNIEFFNMTHGWMSGWGGRDVVLSTEDGGKSWKLQLELNRSIRSVSIINSSSIWASSSGCLYHSVDGGGSWMRIPIPIDNPSQMEFFNESYGWAGSYDGLVKTTDGGNSWLEAESWPNHTFPEDFYITPSITRVATSDGMYLSTDFGKTWSVEYEKNIEAMSFIDENNGWALHPYTVSEYNGEDWKEHSRFSRLLNPYSTGFWDIKFLDENNGWIAGKSPAIAYTPNGGLSWYEHDIGNYRLIAIEVFNESHCWACGWDGVVARTTTGNLLGPKLHTGFYIQSWISSGGRMLPYEPLILAITIPSIFGFVLYYRKHRLKLKN